MPKCGLRFTEPILLKSNPKPVHPIVVLSDMITFSLIIEFLITTLFLIIVMYILDFPLGSITQKPGIAICLFLFRECMIIDLCTIA